MGKKFECKLSHQALDYYYNKRHLTIKEMCEIVGWNGGKHKTSAGYIEIYMPDHPRANKRGCIYEHDYVAEMGIIHRRLKDNEIVHHINRKKDDNRMCNLMVLTREEHTKLHHAEMHEARMRESREVIGG